MLNIQKKERIIDAMAQLLESGTYADFEYDDELANIKQLLDDYAHPQDIAVECLGQTLLNAFDEKVAKYSDYESTTRRMQEVREVLVRTLDEYTPEDDPVSQEQQAWEVISEIHHQDKAYWQDVKNHYLNSLKTKG